MWVWAVLVVVVCVAAAVGALIWAWRMKPPPPLPDDLEALLAPYEADVNVTFRAEDLPEYSAATSSFACPRCASRSYNPNDVREGYCGACHDWTRLDTPLEHDTGQTTAPPSTRRPAPPPHRAHRSPRYPTRPDPKDPTS